MVGWRRLGSRCDTLWLRSASDARFCDASETKVNAAGACMPGTACTHCLESAIKPACWYRTPWIIPTTASEGDGKACTALRLARTMAKEPPKTTSIHAKIT